VRRSGVLLIVLAAALVTAPGAVAQTGLEGHLQALQRIADGNDGNRSAGTAGEAATAAYIARTLRAAGYRVRLQRFASPQFTYLRAGGRTFGRARAVRRSPGADARGVLRAVGRGCRRSDFARLRGGAIALARRGGCAIGAKARRAQRAGAEGLVVVNRRDRLLRAGLRPRGLHIPVVGVPSSRPPRSGQRARITLDGGSGRSVNVLAEGGPAGAPVTMAGGHLDSVKQGAGMNDNASGVAALLHVAERLAIRGLPLRFGFWGAEEMGLVGSTAYVRRLSRGERRRIGAYVNLDMVGSPGGTHQVYDDDERIQQALRATLGADAPPPRIEIDERSDHAPFAAAGIPVGGIFTGVDRCYHRRCDTLANVDLGVLAVSAAAAEQALVLLAG
jgi:hypothetical protein